VAGLQRKDGTGRKNRATSCMSWTPSILCVLASSFFFLNLHYSFSWAKNCVWVCFSEFSPQCVTKLSPSLLVEFLAHFLPATPYPSPERLLSPLSSKCPGARSNGFFSVLMSPDLCTMQRCAAILSPNCILSLLSDGTICSHLLACPLLCPRHSLQWHPHFESFLCFGPSLGISL
jgi:hypothetical protein